MRLPRRRELSLIYPEGRWFNTAGRAPGRHGSARLCSTTGYTHRVRFSQRSLIGKPEPSDPEFNKNRYVVHVLDTLYPDPSLPADERSKVCAGPTAPKESSARTYLRQTP